MLGTLSPQALHGEFACLVRSSCVSNIDKAIPYIDFEKSPKDSLNIVNSGSLSMGAFIDASCIDQVSNLAIYSRICWPVYFTWANLMGSVALPKRSLHCITIARTSNFVTCPPHAAYHTQSSPHLALVGISNMLHPWNTQNHSLCGIPRRSPALGATRTSLLHYQLALQGKPALLSDQSLSIATNALRLLVGLRT